MDRAEDFDQEALENKSLQEVIDGNFYIAQMDKILEQEEKNWDVNYSKKNNQNSIC